MPLTPLRYPTVGGPRVSGGPAKYGLSNYTTDCGRFMLISRGTDEWVVYAVRYEWQRWVRTSGLDCCFASRREALEVLEAALVADGLMDTTDAPV